MRYSRPISVPMAALVSGALHAALAVLFVPALSFLFLVATSGSAAMDRTSEPWMTFAVVAPLLFGVIGLIAGFLMASLFNIFVKQEIRTRSAGGRESRRAMAAVSSAA